MKKIFLFVTLILLSTSLFADLEDTVRENIPASYYCRCEKEGKTSLVKYKFGNSMKSAIVYTPFGYDENDRETKYPVLFLMHGGGGTGATYIGPATCPNSLCWIIDNAILNGDIEPLIIVCPNHNGSFSAELKKALIPLIDEQFNTKATRESRMIGGFSMGSVATWEVYMHDLSLVSYFIPMSGDSWVCGSTGGKTYPEQTATVLSRADNIEDCGGFRIFAATGLRDMAYPNLTPQIQAMKEKAEVFKYTTGDFSNGNLIYYVVPNGDHAYSYTYEYIFNALKVYSKK